MIESSAFAAAAVAPSATAGAIRPADGQHRVAFGVLGPLEVVVAGRPTTPVRPRQRAVLGYLLLNADRRTSIDQLIDAVWAEDPPRTARAQVHTAISRLRAALRSEAGRLTSEGAGYRFSTEAAELDVSVFRNRLAAARQSAADRQPERAARLLREGLALWRGEVLAGLDAPFAAAARHGLEEQRFAAHELLADLDLAAGRHTDLVPRLTELLNTYPARESIARRLALAFHRCGRQTDALAVLRRQRAVLAGEYGLAPGARSAELEAALLRQDPALDLPGPTPAATVRAAGRPEAHGSAEEDGFAPPLPAQCPDRVAGFVGRAGELAALDRLFDAPTPPARVAVVAGPAGVGKSALVREWAERRAASFPDGRLFADLHGFDAADPQPPARILAQFLTALGVPVHLVPADLAQRQALYRSCTAGRRILVVLDNAANAGQVRPLLPGGTAGLTLVTSRDRLDGLIAETGAVPLPLPVLGPEESVEAMRRIAGSDRLAAGPGAARQLARLCGGLPLALRIAAVRLAVEPATSVADLAAELSPPQARLAGLSLPGDQQSVAGALDRSCRRLTAEQTRLFHLLGAHPGPSIGLAAAEVLAGTGMPAAPHPGATSQVRRALRVLESLHLIESAGRDRYTMHPLVRLYACRPGALPEPDRAEAPRRLLVRTAGTPVPCP